MTHDELKAAIESKINGVRDNFTGEAMGAAGIPFHLLLDAIGQVFEDRKITREDEPAVVEVAYELFDTYVVPFDIPYLPNIVVEPLVEKVLRALIPFAIGRLFDLLPE